MRAFRIVQPIFSISYRFWDTRGPKGQKCDFWSHIKVLFFIWFWWDFFHWIPLNEIFQTCSADFFYLLPFLRYKGPKRAKTRFSVECNLTAKHITLVKHIIVSNILLCQTHYCVKQVLESYLFLCTLLLLTCCGRIMLRLRSPSVFIILLYRLIGFRTRSSITLHFIYITYK